MDAATYMQIEGLLQLSILWLILLVVWVTKQMLKSYLIYSYQLKSLQYRIRDRMIPVIER